MPIRDLIINQSFKVGDVEFYQKFDGLDEALIRKSNTGRSNAFWNGNLPRAKTEIKAVQFYDAIMKGYNTISKAIDVISLRTDFTYPLISINGAPKYFNFSFYQHLVKVRGNILVYCREVGTEAHTFFNTESVMENILSLEIDPETYFGEVNQLCSNLITKENPTQEESHILQVLHWLRKSIQEGNNKDKFLDLWVAFEFITSGTSIPKMFEKTEISSLIEMIDKTGFSQDKKEAIKSKIVMLNNPPLMEIFNYLRNTYDVKLTDWELEILHKARNKRVDIIHGKKDVEIQPEELTKMRTILEKMLIKKITYLKAEK